MDLEFFKGSRTPGRLNRVSGHKSGFMDGGGTWGHGAEGSGIFLGGCKAERNETHLFFGQRGWGKRNLHIFSVDWLREGSTYFVLWDCTKKIWFLNPKAEGNIAHIIIGQQGWGKRNLRIFSVNWMREGSKYFMSWDWGAKTGIFFSVLWPRETSSVKHLGRWGWGKRNLYIFGVNWLREGSKHFVSWELDKGQQNRYGLDSWGRGKCGPWNF